MPALTILFVRTALLALVIGSAGGAVLLSAKTGFPAHLPAWIRTWHQELMPLGWFGNLTLGVAYWILPRHAHAPARGSPVPPAIAYAALNLGVVLAASGQVASGRTLELLAAVTFAAHAAGRLGDSAARRRDGETARWRDG